MKTVCKKLLCLMLVAMMLISAVPFAFATPLSTEVKCPQCGEVAYYHEGGARVDATCEAGGKECYKCDTPACKGEEPYYYFLVDSPAAGHKWNDGEVTTAATCESDGVKTYTCTVTGCKKTKTEAIAKTGHDYESEITTPATCTEDGVKTFTCKNDAAHTYTEVIAATGHNYVGGECTKCGDDRAPYKTITFYYLDSNGNETSAVRSVYASGEEVTPPSVPVNPKSGFSYWKQYANDTGMKLNKDEVLVVNSETPTAFHAIYNAKSGMSELKIYVVRYVNGVRKEANYLFSSYFTTGNTNNMYEYLWDNDDAIVTAAVGEIGEGYTWNNKFYNYFTDEELTDANMKDNGNKSVYIKMNTKNANEAQVLLYVHKSKTSTVHDILEMDGYNKGEKVYLNDVKDFLKDEGYKWSSISSLYTDEEWDDLLDGESPSGSNHISINDNGTYKIHVILKNASQSNNADSSNPKTGDSIMIAVTTMGLAAAAMVALVELKKRKMI